MFAQVSAGIGGSRHDKHLKLPKQHQKNKPHPFFSPTLTPLSAGSGLDFISNMSRAEGGRSILLAEGWNVNNWRSLSCGIQTGNGASEF